jgi:hypothetical protein
VWDLEHGASLATFTGEGALLACAITPNGGMIAAGGSSGQLHLLRLMHAANTRPIQ